MLLPRRPRHRRHPVRARPQATEHPPPRWQVRLTGRTAVVGAAVAALASTVLVGPGVSSWAVGSEADQGSSLIERWASVATSFDRPAEVERSSATPAVRITVRGSEREQVLPPPVELRDNDVLPVGEVRVDETGEAGLRHEIVEVILHNDVEVDERVVATTERPPTPTIISVGTSTSEAAARDWAALARCESGGDPTIVSRSGRYHGLYQFDRSTWESVGGTGLPSEATPDEQRRRAILLYEQRGAQPWPTCGRHL